MDNGRKGSRSGIYAAIIVIALAAGIGVVGVAGARTTATEYFIEAHAADSVWHPNTRTIQKGDTVTWTFEAGGFHNVKSTSSNWSFTSGTDPSHDPVSYPFTDTGTYTFVCGIHPGMTGTITVQNDPVPTDTATATVTQTASPTPSPTPTPTPTTQAGHNTTPPPSGGTDTVKPTVGGVRLKALRRAVRVQFRLSEPATVTVNVKRSRKLIASKRVQTGTGSHAVTLRSKRLKKGRYAVEIRARDAFGNQSRLATKRLTLRR